MQAAEDCGGVRQAMQLLPAGPAQGADHGVGRGRREWQHDQQAGPANGEIRTERDFGPGAGQGPFAIEAEKEQEVRQAIGERVEPEGPPGGTQPAPPGPADQRCDGEREHQHDQREHPGGADGEVDGVAPQVAPPGVVGEQQSGDRRVPEHHPLGKVHRLRHVDQRPFSGKQLRSPPCGLPGSFPARTHWRRGPAHCGNGGHQRVSWRPTGRPAWPRWWHLWGVPPTEPGKSHRQGDSLFAIRPFGVLRRARNSAAGRGLRTCAPPARRSR